ncbi:hypothetical protein BC936DRAFT_143079, partial [Jimgerdemannia flammicorona]
MQPEEDNYQVEEDGIAMEEDAQPQYEEEQPPPEEAEEQIEDEEDMGLTTEQSFWMFGGLINEFRDACVALRNGIDAEKFAEADRALVAIMAIYLKSAIPPENLAPAIASHIRQNSSATELPEEYLQDTTSNREQRDLADLLFDLLWETREEGASREKMIRLLACVTKSKREHDHAMGGRLLVELLRRSPRNFDGSLLPNAPPIFDWYRSFVIYTLYGSSGPGEESAYEQQSRFKQFVLQDMKVLQEVSISLFYSVAPLLYRHLADACVGDAEFLHVVVAMIAPAQVYSLACKLIAGEIEVFGITNDYDEILEPALEWETFEQIVMWQLINAELGGRVDKVERLVSKSAVVGGLEAEHNPEPLPALLTLLRSVPPTPTILKHLIPMAFPLEGPASEISESHMRFALAALEQWRRVWREPLEGAVADVIASMAERVENWADEDMAIEEAGDVSKRSSRDDAAQAVVMLQGWWRFSIANGRKEELGELKVMSHEPVLPAWEIWE